MLSLLLLRHAKSSWDDTDLEDHDRQLTKRGTKAALRVGRYIAENNLIPDVIVSSDAIRTRATLTLVLKAIAPDLPPPTVITNDLYLAAPETILEVVVREAGVAKRIMVIGHNPGVHALALSLPASGRRSDLTALAMKFPTAALAEISFDMQIWGDVRPASGHLQRFVVPRSLSDA